MLLVDQSVILHVPYRYFYWQQVELTEVAHFKLIGDNIRDVEHENNKAVGVYELPWGGFVQVQTLLGPDYNSDDIEERTHFTWEELEWPGRVETWLRRWRFFWWVRRQPRNERGVTHPWLDF